jgi:hypothetical protein
MPWSVKYPDLKNDPSYLEPRVSNAETQLAQKVNQTDFNSKFGSMGNTKTFKGSCTFAALPTNGMVVDDYWYVTDRTSNYCWNGAAWVDIGNGITISNGSITPEKTNFIELIVGKNKFNKATATQGYYKNYLTGQASVLANWFYSDFIPFTSGLNVVAQPTNSGYHVCFYDSNKNYLSGVTGSSFTTPANCAYVVISMPVGNLNSAQVEIGTVVTSYETYAAYQQLQPKYVPPSVGAVHHSITVKPDGTGDFTNLSAAIASITDASFANIYDIYIYEGTYDVYSTLTASELSGSGILLPDYANLIGVGNKDNIIIKMALADTTTLDESSRLSPLNVKYNNILKNLTVTAQNCRYVVHSDNGNAYYDYILNVENCTFIHYGNAAGLWAVPNAWGEGTSSGAKLTFKNCDFIAYAGLGYNTHNNTNFAKPDYHEFENCKFISKDGYCVGFTSLSSGKISRVLMKGCKFTGKIKQDQSNSSVTTLEYQIEGYSNEKVPHDVVLQSGQTLQNYINFSEEISIKTNYNAVVISRGTPIKHKFYNQAIPMVAGDDKTLFVGLCAKDCLATDKHFAIKKSGYFPIAQTSLTGVATGNKIGIVNGQLAIVTNIYDAIAVAVDGTYMKFL